MEDVNGSPSACLYRSQLRGDKTDLPQFDLCEVCGFLFRECDWLVVARCVVVNRGILHDECVENARKCG